MDNEAAQTAAASASEPNVENPGQATQAMAQRRLRVEPSRRTSTRELQEGRHSTVDKFCGAGVGDRTMQAQNVKG